MAYTSPGQGRTAFARFSRFKSSRPTRTPRRSTACFADVRDTFYGDVWNVKTKDESRNIANTSLFLGLHMDLQYFESPPRFQILHCLHDRVHSGIFLFVDTFAAAETLRLSHPPDFTRLFTTPVPFQYIMMHDTYTMRVQTSPETPPVA